MTKITQSPDNFDWTVLMDICLLRCWRTSACWASLRKTMAVQQRVTARMKRADGRTIHVRKNTRAEPAFMIIYQALGISAAPGCTIKLIA